MSNLLNGGGRRLGSIFLPLILIGLGALLLLRNAGLIQVSIWDVVGRLWPLIPVLIGIELLIGQRSPRAAVLVMLLVSIGAGAGIALFASDPGRFPVGWTVNITSDKPPGEVGSRIPRIEEPLEDVERAAVELRLGAGELQLSSLPADSSLLIAGDPHCRQRPRGPGVGGDCHARTGRETGRDRGGQRFGHVRLRRVMAIPSAGTCSSVLRFR